MEPFSKRRISGAEIAEIFYDIYKRAYEDGQKEKPLIEETRPENLLIVQQEWVYLDAFQFDYFAYLALDETPQKAAVLTGFWKKTRGWLKEVNAPALPGRMGPSWREIQVIPAEGSESMFERLKRRCELYRKAIIHPSGDHHGLANMFAITCNVPEFSFVAGIATYVYAQKLYYVNLLQSLEIVL
jgi:hypothetical protein